MGGPSGPMLLFQIEVNRAQSIGPEGRPTKARDTARPADTSGSTSAALSNLVRRMRGRGQRAPAFAMARSRLAPLLQADRDTAEAPVGATQVATAPLQMPAPPNPHNRPNRPEPTEASCRSDASRDRATSTTGATRRPRYPPAAPLIAESPL
ncbi:DUF6053 domain-containing protein [Lysobacter enzymogenes]|uniref:DUF6053 domain-containing protein n=1 Tax=Lysobacter enzymogenes TaxID=69 RepID=UPI003D1898D9